MPATEKKDKPVSMKEWHQYYQSIIRCMPNLVYVLDKNCVLTACNDQVLRLLGIDDIKDLNDTFYSRLINHTRYSENRINHLKRDDINALLSGADQSNHNEPPVIDSEGNIIHYSANRTLLFDKDKHVSGMVVVLTDVTERKKLDEQIEKIREKLQEFNKLDNKGMSHTASIQRSKQSPPKILMVEDNLLAQKAAQSLLLQLDCLVDVADSSEEAMKLFKPGKYDLVFMDIGLQDTSGYLVSKKIRQLENNTGHRVPIIALTGYEADVVKIDCNEYFMEGAITKPLSTEQAKQIIERYIHHIDIAVRGLKSADTSQLNQS